MITESKMVSMLLSEWAKVAEQEAAGKPQSVIDSIEVPEDLFSIRNVSSNELQVGLYKRAGEALGLDIRNIGEDFGADIRQAFDNLEAQPDGADRIDEISSSLDLDEMGFSLNQLITAIEDPNGEDAELFEKQLQMWLDKVDENLRAQSEISRETRSPVVLDDLGLYGTR